jgi:hypothetical protein
VHGGEGGEGPEGWSEGDEGSVDGQGREVYQGQGSYQAYPSTGSHQAYYDTAMPMYDGYQVYCHFLTLSPLVTFTLIGVNRVPLTLTQLKCSRYGVS